MSTDLDLIWMQEKARSFFPPELRPRFDEIVRTRMERCDEDPVAAAIDRLGEKLDPLIEAASRPQYMIREDPSGPVTVRRVVDWLTKPQEP